MYATKFRAAAWLVVLGVLLLAVPQGAFAKNNGSDCDYCYDLPCTIEWVRVVATAVVSYEVCGFIAVATSPAGGIACAIYTAIVTTLESESFEDCSNQDECYDQCMDDVC